MSLSPERDWPSLKKTIKKKQFYVIIIYSFTRVQLTMLPPIPSLQVYVEYAVRNPLLSLDAPIDSELFRSKIESFISSKIRDSWPD